MSSSSSTNQQDLFTINNNNNSNEHEYVQHQEQQHHYTIDLDSHEIVDITNTSSLLNDKTIKNLSEGNAGFLRAARAGNLDKVIEYLNENIDINISNSNGLNALHLASKEGHVHVVDELLRRGALVDAATKKGNTALHIASLAGQFEVVKVLVQNGANVDCRSQNGFTPLYMAAQENFIDIVKYLLDSHANQSLATEDGFTPLAVALQQGHDKVVAILLENDTKGKIRLPALHIAAKKNDVKAAALLLNNETSANADASPEAGKSGFTPLHIAAHYGNIEIAEFLISKGADVNYEARQAITPLHVAAKWGKLESVNLLLDSGAKIDAKTRDGLTPLHCAARSGNDQIVEHLYQRGAPINAKTKNGLTALHMAAQGEHVEAARILLYNSPILVDQTTCDYLTALHVAAHCGHVKIAKLLLERKAEVNARALNGFTPLHIACKKNRIKVIELLIKHGASKEATTESGLTPLHVASFMGCMNVVVFLIQHGSAPNVQTIRGETPLHLAARANQTDIVRILLRHGAIVDAKAKEQQTPLHIATRLGNNDIVSLLLRHGANVDAATSDGYTALHIASKEGQEEVAGVLLENGASLNVTTKKGFTPLHIASKYGNVEVASLLLRHKADSNIQGKNGLTPLHVATHYNRPVVAALLLQHGASPHIIAKNGYTALHIAAKKNQIEIAQELFNYEAVTNCESNAGFTPLHLACQEGHLDMVQLLIEHLANTNSTSKNGLTPLHLCAQEDKVNCAAVLVQNMAAIDPQTKAGYTPLHVACHFGQINMVKFLLQHHANVDIVTKHGFTALHCAAQQGHVLIVKLLLETGASPDITNNNGQTALAIAHRLGYISVVEELKQVTQTTVVTTTTSNKLIEEKYKVQTPETMQETFMSDSEDEDGVDAMLGDAEHYKYITNENEYNNMGDDSIALTPKTPKRGDEQQVPLTTATTTETTTETATTHQNGSLLANTIIKSVISKEHHQPDKQQQQQQMQTQADQAQQPVTLTTTTTTTTTVTAATVLTNLIMPTNHDQQQNQQQKDLSKVQYSFGHLSTDSIDGSYCSAAFDTTKSQLNQLEADNIPVQSKPKTAGFLISFLVDARGGAMRGCRHSGIRIIIPPRRCAAPTRITCRYLRKEKQNISPPIGEGEALAARVLEMGPQNCKFLGSVVIEIPHFASLRNKEREILVLRSDNGEKWIEHPIQTTDTALEEALGGPIDQSPLLFETTSSQAETATTAYSTDEKRVTRIITQDFPKYFALVTRVRQEVHQVGEPGGVISSTVVPKAQAVFPEKALQKKIKLSLQAMPIPPELVAKLFGNRVAVSPIVTIEPRRRKFHKAITLTIPAPKAAHKGMINQYTNNQEPLNLRLLCSITGGLVPAQWEDITGHTPLSHIDECISFTTTVSARFWLIDCQNINEVTQMANEIYREAIAVPFMCRFVVYAKRHEQNEAKLRVFCVTDDKDEKTLERRENFQIIAKSREVEVLESCPQWLEVTGNLIPISKSCGSGSGEQLNFVFKAFKENRLPFNVRLKDPTDNSKAGRLVFLKDPKTFQPKSDIRQQPICTLDIDLPSYNKEEIEAETIKRTTISKTNLNFIKFGDLNTIETTKLIECDVNLNELANCLDDKWRDLAVELKLNEDEIDFIEHTTTNNQERAYELITYWRNREKENPERDSRLTEALKNINFDHNKLKSLIVSRSSIDPNDTSNKDELNQYLNSSSSVRKGTSLDVSYDDRDITKESESAEVSDNEESSKKLKRANLIQFQQQHHHIHHPIMENVLLKKSSWFTNNVDSSVNATTHSTAHTSSLLNDENYCKKVDKEYEAIKRSILSRSPITHQSPLMSTFPEGFSKSSQLDHYTTTPTTTATSTITSTSTAVFPKAEEQKREDEFVSELKFETPTVAITNTSGTSTTPVLTAEQLRKDELYATALSSNPSQRSSPSSDQLNNRNEQLNSSYYDNLNEITSLKEDTLSQNNLIIGESTSLNEELLTENVLNTFLDQYNATLGDNVLKVEPTPHTTSSTLTTPVGGADTTIIEEDEFVKDDDNGDNTEDNISAASSLAAQNDVTDNSSSSVATHSQLDDILKHVYEAEQRTRELEELDKRLTETIEYIRNETQKTRDATITSNSDNTTTTTTTTNIPPSTSSESNQQRISIEADSLDISDENIIPFILTPPTPQDTTHSQNIESIVNTSSSTTSNINNNNSSIDANIASTIIDSNNNLPVFSQIDNASYLKQEAPSIEITEDNTQPLEEDDMRLLNDALKDYDMSLNNETSAEGGEAETEQQQQQQQIQPSEAAPTSTPSSSSTNVDNKNIETVDTK